MSQPRAVSLDIWGTLLGSDPDFKSERNALLRGTFAPHCDATEFDLAMRQADRDADEICMSRGRDVGFAERVRLTLSRLQLSDTPVEAALPDLLEQQAKLAEAHPPRALHTDLPAAVERLGERMPVVFTSNTGMLPGVLMRRLLELAEFTGSFGCVFSDEAGWAKPDARIFSVTMDRISARAREPIAPAGVLHVGDNPRADVDGATSFGMRAALIAPDGDSTLAVLKQIEGE